MLASPFFRRIFLPYLILIFLTAGLVGVQGARRVRAAYLERTRTDLHDSSVLIAELVGNDIAAQRLGDLREHIRRLGIAIRCRITIVRSDGVVIADNEADPAHMDNHRLRPEIVDSVSQGDGGSVRRSGTLHQDLFYFAHRVGEGESAWFVRLAVHLTDLNAHLRRFYAELGGTVLLAMVVGAGVCYLLARRHALPVVELTQFAGALAAGDLERRILRNDTGEIGALAAALNSMADALRRLVAQTTRDRAELLAVLTSMSEGVIATDAGLRIVLSNAAAGGLLDLGGQPLQGKLLWEVVRSEPLLRAARGVISAQQPATVQIGPLGGRHLEAVMTPFPLPHAPPGVVIVVHDVTQSVRYQELRKEFVANVSHELRTPLTAIKGFAETLREGALTDPVRGPEFLATIEKHVDQLANLIDDLLEVSRLESHVELPRCVPLDLAAAARRAVELFASAAQKKNQRLTLDAPADALIIQGHPDYLERAIANLVDNAIKYTPPGGRIDVSLGSNASTAWVAVIDTGIGIPAEDLPRIFERFYRVDRSRSREMGGTGLGLSIVKHVANAHHGAVDVTSSPGAGSTFRLTLPIHAGE